MRTAPDDGAAEDAGDQPAALRQTPFGHQVRDALVHLHDLVYLQTHPLVERLGREEGGAAPRAGRRLQETLLETIEAAHPGEDAPPGSYASRSYELLRLRYADGLPVPTVQARLGVGKSEYSRAHQAGLEAVISLLRERWAAAPPAERRPAARPAARVPRFLSSFVGREREMAQAAALLRAGRLVTFTGAPGTGKTRLACAVAADVVDAFPDGAWFVDLAPLADPGFVPHAVAAALGVREAAGRPLPRTLEEHLAPRCLLLVLDNCEHVVAASAGLAASLLGASPALRVVATSREPLHLAGELRFPVPTLAAPELGSAPAPEEVAGYAAVQLFVERARAVEPSFALTERNAPAVARLCARLDGIPLAIELAAAQLRVLSVEQILARLDEGVRLLAGDERTTPDRHRTLEATLDWSHRLLGEEERVAFRRLAVFAGGFDLAAAEAVCGHPAPPSANRAPPSAGAVGAGSAFASRVESFERDDPREPETRSASLRVEGALDLLAGLVDRSLVLKDERGGEARYRLLEPLRQYARARLAESGEEGAIGRRHAEHYLALSEQAERAVRGPEQVAWLDRLDREHGNLRAALRWYLDDDQAELALRLGSALWQYWRVRGHRQEGLGWLEEALARDPGRSPGLRARALRLAGTFADLRGELRRARAWFEESLALWRRLLDSGGLAATLCDLARLLARAAREPGEYGRAMALFDEALALQRRAGDAWEIGWVLYHAGRAAVDHGDLARAAAEAREGAALFESTGDRHYRAHAVDVLGEAAWRSGDLETAARLFRESLAVMRDVGCPDGTAKALLGQAGLARDHGDTESSAALCGESLKLHHELGLKVGIAGCLDAIAGLAGARGRFDRAARLLGSAEALREAIGVPVVPVDRPAHERDVAAARAGLGGDGFVAAFAAGQRMALDEAIAYALDDTAS